MSQVRAVSISRKELFTLAIKRFQGFPNPSMPARPGSPGRVPPALPEMPQENGGSSRSGLNQKLQEGTETKSFAIL